MVARIAVGPNRAASRRDAPRAVSRRAEPVTTTRVPLEMDAAMFSPRSRHAEQLKNVDQLERVGGIDYLGHLVSAVPTAANVEYHANIIREKALLRRLVEQAHQDADGRALARAVGAHQADRFALEEAEAQAETLNDGPLATAP